MLDDFDRVRKIGEGAFGKALLVRSKKDGKHYVIKEINISKMAAKERKESLQEVKLLSTMEHPNIVSFLESFQERGNLYIVMDYCDGGDLYKKINNRRGEYFTEDQVLDWFVQIASALKHVHDRKILHRDIKTQNIFLTRSGTIKLGDFGIARVLKNTMELARTCIGTPYYLSPEICEGRPYNNKSDVWSLGCVLYEMLTLKHAFEGGNMKNLVLKIVKGSYPPVPPRYSADVRVLVSRLLKRRPEERPSIKTVLRQPIILNRYRKFSIDEVVADEVSHAVLQRQAFGVPAQKPVPGRVGKAAAEKFGAPKKISKPAAKYGVSVAKKIIKKPPNDPYNARKPYKAAGEREAERAREIDAREKRRQQLQKEQEEAYNKMMDNIQKQRWQKQQMEKINRAKEQNWRNSGNILSPEKQAAPMRKYQNAGKENRPHSAYDAGHRPAPAPAWQAVKQGQENRVRAAEAGDRARVLEEFWQRKREALANKNRGGKPVGGPSVKANNLAPVPAPAPQIAAFHVGEVKSRNPGEQNYLARLEAIRKQNYKERIAIQQRMAKVRGPVAKPSSGGENGDPRVDPEARRKKIAALKAQADERAAMLKKQLEVRREAVFDRVQREAKAEAKQNEEKEVKHVYQRPISAVEKKPEERPAVPAVGLETALKQVGATRLFRSHSEGDLSNAIKESCDENSEEDEIQRKQWAAKPFRPLMFPLEATASAMEATSADDIVIKPAPKLAANNARSKWDHGGKTQLVSALQKVDIQPGTLGMPAGESKVDESAVNKDVVAKEKREPVAWVAGGSNKQNMGVTVSVSKEPPTSSGTSTNLGVTVVKSSVDLTKKSVVDVPPSNVGRPLPPPPVTKPGSTRPLPTLAEAKEKQEKSVKVENIDKQKQTSPDQNKPSAPVKAWEETPQSGTSSKREFPEARKSYQEFLNSRRSNSKSPDEKEQEPLFEKIDVKKEAATKKDDLKIQDISSDEEKSFYQTAELTDVSPIALNTGRYDTDVKRLRTCSLPDLRLLFETVEEDKGFNEEGDECLVDCENVKPSTDEDKEEVNCEDDDDPEQEVDIDIACDESDEESEDYISMLASMEDVLVSDARSPSPIKTVRNLEATCNSDSDDDSDTNDDIDSQSSTPLPLNEGWDSGDSEDEESHDKSKQKEDEESVFARLEESRKVLEDELGFSRFMKVYKYIQSIQENEDDVDVDVGPAPEISDLLGAEYEHLYPKILYLVMADSAYCEDND
ncbi:serine/threonine-protein kinase Nek1-like isoform X2 [Dendronephthya gigantea]|uniref:serine/threonine-protein kinase Nek1-like isoform X2 n=1 Tax=Dendronephthya gigantea TaxID=151771 RepID=UPI00106CE772|nr:serine/threonine-protein kinase Nek1-like isoform X2 [Dendronephthya gigantea]